MSEEELQDQLVEKIDPDDQENGLLDDYQKDIQVGQEVPIIKDCTFMPTENFDLYLGHTKTDVCIYLEQERLSDHLNESDNFKLYQNGDKEINVPLVIFETKRGEVTTDQIRSRTIVAREINEIFPFCRYYFVADQTGGVTPEKVHRAGKHFDGFFLDGDDKEKDLSEQVRNVAKSHLDRLAGNEVIEESSP